MTISYGHWDTSLVGKFNPEDHLGFVYQITHLDSGKSYIGCKHLWKFKKKSKKRVKASAWKNYCSSSNYLKPDINEYGKEAFRFLILMLCPNKRDLYYNEAKLQMELGVLESDRYYNANVGGLRFYRPVKSYLDDSIREKVRGIKNGRYRGTFYVTYTGGLTVEVSGITVKDWCKDQGLNQSALASLRRGNQKSHKGVTKLEYEDER